MPRLLTDRQGDVLRQVCRGPTHHEAAAAPGISHAFVGSYAAIARVRLGSGTPAELCARRPDDLAATEERARRRSG